MSKFTRWMDVKLLAHLLDTAALWVGIQTYLKTKNFATKVKEWPTTLTRHKNKQKEQSQLSAKLGGMLVLAGTLDVRVSVDTVDFQAEVDEMTIDYLLPLSKPSTPQVADIVYLKKKCRIARLRLISLDLWKSRGIGRNVFFTLK